MNILLLMVGMACIVIIALSIVFAAGEQYSLKLPPIIGATRQIFLYMNRTRVNLQVRNIERTIYDKASFEAVGCGGEYVSYTTALAFGFLSVIAGIATFICTVFQFCCKRLPKWVLIIPAFVLFITTLVAFSVSTSIYSNQQCSQKMSSSAYHDGLNNASIIVGSYDDSNGIPSYKEQGYAMNYGLICGIISWILACFVLMISIFNCAFFGPNSHEIHQQAKGRHCCVSCCCCFCCGEDEGRRCLQRFLCFVGCCCPWLEEEAVGIRGEVYAKDEEIQEMRRKKEEEEMREIQIYAAAAANAGITLPIVHQMQQRHQTVAPPPPLSSSPQPPPEKPFLSDLRAMSKREVLQRAVFGQRPAEQQRHQQQERSNNGVGNSAHGSDYGNHAVQPSRHLRQQIYYQQQQQPQAPSHLMLRSMHQQQQHQQQQQQPANRSQLTNNNGGLLVVDGPARAVLPYSASSPMVVNHDNNNAVNTNTNSIATINFNNNNANMNNNPLPPTMRGAVRGGGGGGGRDDSRVFANLNSTNLNFDRNANGVGGGGASQQQNYDHHYANDANNYGMDGGADYNYIEKEEAPF